jgi:quercetin dioxygenase-like cupin family protein
MPTRDPAIQEFLTSLKEVFRATAIGPEASAAIDRIYGALQTPGAAGPEVGKRLPVCRYLDDALVTARTASASLARITDAFAALEPSLAWKPRPAGGPFASDNWPEGHANATVVGPNGLEHQEDLAIGASLLAPHVRYPDHNHGPEEVYLVLSPGRFQHGESGWFEPGPGGTLYNRPNIKHAMASDEAPLLAFWCHWIRNPA